MKNLLLNSILIISATFFSVDLTASKNNRFKYDSLSCLQIEGKIVNANEGQNGECIIELLGPNDGIDTLLLKDGKRKFRFVLQKNAHYAIRISKKGYLNKLVTINTEIVKAEANVQVFEFETTLLKEEILEKINQDILDFPIAIIYFNYEKDSFSYNKEYSDYIRRELYNVTPVYSTPPADKNILTPLLSKELACAVK